MITIHGTIENGALKTDVSLDELEGREVVLVAANGVADGAISSGEYSRPSTLAETQALYEARESNDSLLEWIEDNEIDDPDLPPSSQSVEDRKGWSDLRALITRNQIDDPDLPADFAHEHEHYLYGTPKQGNG